MNGTCFMSLWTRTVWLDGSAKTEGNDRQSVGEPTDAQVYTNKNKEFSGSESESKRPIKIIGLSREDYYNEALMQKKTQPFINNHSRFITTIITFFIIQFSFCFDHYFSVAKVTVHSQMSIHSFIHPSVRKQNPLNSFISHLSLPSPSSSSPPSSSCFIFKFCDF